MKNKAYDLKKKAKAVRRSVLEMAYRAKSAHTGGSLSCVEILTTLYFAIMQIDPKRPDDPKRDRLVFSKAHDCKALYAVLAERGYFPKEKLIRYELDGGLPGHATKTALPGIEMSAGSLGHGLSVAAGMAYAAKSDKKKYHIFAVLSDGECDAGSTWEAILFAGHHHLDNFTVVVDYNKIQSYGRTHDVLNLEPFTDKWKSFQWAVRETDGHDVTKLKKIFAGVPFTRGKPSVIIAHTVKGFGGVKQHIDKVSSHYRPPSEEEFQALLHEEGI